MWVVKIGGSLAGSAALARWVRAVATPAKTAVAIVPGGGEFADAVRSAQRREAFDDARAHRLAVAAMEQYGSLLCGLDDRLVPASTAEEILNAQRRGRVPVWMAQRMALAAPEIPASWDVTSDSLAAWLAARLAADALYLVKSVAPDGPGPIAASELTRRGVVDAAFPAMVARGCFAMRWLGPEEHAAFAAALRSGAICGAEIARNP